MAVRTAYDPVNGTALTETNLERFPGGWIGYVEITTSQTGITANVDVTGLTLTVTVGTSRRLMLQASTRVFQATSAATPVVDITTSGNTVLASWQASMGISGVQTAQPMCVLTPSSGSNTWKLRASTGAGTLEIHAAATFPAFFMIEDVGPSA
jgi:hypothetical protein